MFGLSGWIGGPDSQAKEAGSRREANGGGILAEARPVAVVVGPPRRGAVLEPLDGPPVVSAPSPEGRVLSGRVHTYTKYRDRLSPWESVWSETGDPPLPVGWTGRWTTPAEARLLGMVSVYRKILDEALSPDGGFLD